MSRSLRKPTGPEVAVFVSGVASMGLEILAGRMIAPEFGNSIYTWGSIIGVFLTALSLGYYLGGRRAARRASRRRLVGLLVGTAGYVAIVIFAGDILLRSAEIIPLPARFGSVPAVTLLFGPPTYLLGFISPYAAELSRKDTAGEASGHVYALGTIGSIVGAFGTTFALIPAFGVDTIAFLFGGVTLTTAGWLLAPEFPRRATLQAVIVAVLLVGAVLSPTVGVSAEGQIIHQAQTPHQELEVIDRGTVRTLYLDGQRHSAMDRSEPERHVFEYTRYFHLPYLFANTTTSIDRVLFVGGGGFTGPKQFDRRYNVTVDVVEIDRTVIDVAKRYFGVKESPTLRIHNTGGRQYLSETDRTYDLIVLDAYRKDTVPFQLTTVEFMELLDERLTADGMVVANLISAPSGPASQFYRAEYKTMDQVFSQVYTFPTTSAPVVQNVELVATKHDGRVNQSTLRARNDRRAIGLDLETAVSHYRPPPRTDDVPVLRDDRAPVDRLLDPMVGQQYVIDETANVSRTETERE